MKHYINRTTNEIFAYEDDGSQDHLITSDLELLSLSKLEVLRTPAGTMTYIQPVSPRQIRQALTRINLRQAVEAAVAAGDQDIKDWWEFSTQFDRTNSVSVAMATALGVTEKQMDDLWLLAGSL